MKKIISLTVICLFFAVSNFSQTDSSDIQLWNETTLEFPFDSVNKKLSGIIIGNLRATDNIGRLSDRRIGFAVKYKVRKNLTVQPSYIFRQQTQNYSNPSKYEHRLRLDITPKKTFKRLSVENRSRFEHRFKTNGRNDDTFYRNRTKLKFPIKTNDGTEIITPFVSNDTYFDIQNPRIHRNDSVIGISKKITKNFTTIGFYQYRRNFQSSQKHLNIFGINVKLHFK